MTTVASRIKDLVRPIYQATETGDVDLLDTVFVEDAVEHPLNPGQVRGRDAIKHVFGGFHLIVPDLRITIQDIVAEGDKVAVRSTVRGTPTASFLGAPPSGRPMAFDAIDIWRIAGARVVEGWHVEDFVGVLMDWGMLPLPSRRAPASTSAPTDSAAHNGFEADAKEIVRTWYQALHRADLVAIGNLLDARFVNHDPLGPALAVSAEREEARRDIAALHSAFPDLDVIVADVFAEAERVVARVIVRGTHLGPLPGVTPTGRRVAVMGNEIWRVAGGHIVEHWGRFEELDLLQQLGVLPSEFVPTGRGEPQR